ncbi:hypothetical protein J6590_029820 [Homalodisca vitripennis]|nr:hypothetical protein J6590_029820 [Homalodisca vitripennis]
MFEKSNKYKLSIAEPTASPEHSQMANCCGVSSGKIVCWSLLLLTLLWVIGLLWSGIVQSRTEVDLTLTDFDKDKREAIVSIPRKMLVKYTEGNDCQHKKSSTIFTNKKYTEENSV